MLKKYVVIGGQYNSYCYGSADTLHGAKLLATQNLEHWDNWQGWHFPAVYRREDVAECNNFFGDSYAPKECAEPVATREYGKKWATRDNI